MTSHPSTIARYVTAGLAIFALVVMPLAIYTAGYLWLGEKHDRWAAKAEVAFVERTYPQQWMTTAFRPAAKFEAWLRGMDVQTTWGKDRHWHEAERPWPVSGP